MENEDLMSKLWKLLSLLLVGSFVVHTVVHHGEMTASDDLWLYLTYAFGAAYTLVGTIALIESN